MSSSVNPVVVGVLSAVVPLIWDDVSKVIAPAVVYADGKVTIEEIYGNLLSKDMQLWITQNSSGTVGSVCITRVMVGLTWKRLEICFYAGDYETEIVKAYWDILSEFAKTNGCEAIEAVGRNGFVKKLGKFNFTPIYTTFRVKL